MMMVGDLGLFFPAVFIGPSCCDSELEPRRQRTDGVDLFVDLGATLEDHGEVISFFLLTPRMSSDQVRSDWQ